MNQHAARFVVSNFIVQYAPNPSLAAGHIAVGYTVTKKIGGAVIRNRTKRRLREALRVCASNKAKDGYHYVFIARHAILKSDFATLLRDMEFAFSKIKVKQGG